MLLNIPLNKTGLLILIHNKNIDKIIYSFIAD